MIDSGLFTNVQSKSDYKITLDNLSQSDMGSICNEFNHPADPDIDGLKRPRAVSLATKRVSEQVYSHARQGKFVMTLGGDHSIGIGTVSGVAKAIRERLFGEELAVLWIDAHADINTPLTSLSGRIHGMPVAFVSGLASTQKKGVFDWITESHLINLRKFVYIGLRDVDDAENDLIKQHGIKAFMMDDVRRSVSQAFHGT